MPPDDDDETQLQLDAAGTALSAQRRHPTLAWTDAQGAHSVTLQGKKVLGTAAGVDLAVADGAVSRLHAELELRDDGVWVQDLGSRNGTYVESVRVMSARVPDGGRVRVGRTQITVAHPPKATTVPLWPGDRFGPLLGRSVAMRELFAQLAQIAVSEATVLVQGETGTGKELVAQALHEASPRRAGPFIVVDCAALPENLLEAELFGHARGSFTGATGSRAGAIESAEGGTVFLDEIGELALPMQPKLLRAMESRMVRRIGENAHRKVDVRFVSATHRDLRKMVNAGAFREDLYFRLAVVPVTVPPLRARKDDIELLVAGFVGQRAGAQAPSPEVLRELANNPWLGNVRELRNFVERALVLGSQRALSMVPTGAEAAAAGDASALPTVTADEPFKDLRERWLNHLEREYLTILLERHGGNVSAVAQAAMLDRTYVHRLIRKHDL